VALHLALGILVAHKVAGNGSLIGDFIALLAVVLSFLCRGTRGTSNQTIVTLDDGGSAGGGGGGGHTYIRQVNHIGVQGIRFYVRGDSGRCCLLGLAEVWLVQMVKSNKSLLFRTEIVYLVLILKD